MHDLRRRGAYWVCWRLFLLVSNQLFAAPFGMVGVLVFRWWDVVEIAVDPLLVVPLDPHQRGKFDLLNGSPRSLIRPVDQLRFVQRVDAFSRGVVIGVPDRTY
jgi:hypothetical protein